MKFLSAILLAALFSIEAQAQSSKVDTVPGLSAMVHEMTVPAGRLTRVVVRGGRHTDLDLYIFDGNGNLIGADEDYSSFCAVSWTPRWTGVFYIKIVNRGLRSNTYTVSVQ